MTKTTRSDLVREVQEELITYLGSGQRLNQAAVANAFDIPGLGIADFERLKGIRFALSEDVRKYVNNLDGRLRSVRTASEVETEQQRGEVRGAVDWGQTVRERYARNPHDKALFVTRTPYTEYQLPENIVLKTFVAILARIARQDLLAIDQSWRRDLWADEDIESFVRLFDQNVHLDRIEADHRTILEPRQLTAARKSRQQLYYRAYELYRRYEKLLDNQFDDDSVVQLLRETLTVPETSRLFELVCTFRLLNGLKGQFDVTLQPIETGSGPIALGRSDDWELTVYHDATGSLQFRERFPEQPQDTYLDRLEDAHEGHRSQMGKTTLRAIYQGRPDVLVEIRPVDTPYPTHIILGEVKYTESNDTLSEGILELNKYLQFARPRADAEYDWPIDSEEYLIETADIDVTCLAITDGASHPISDEQLHHVTAAELHGDDLFDCLQASS